MAIDWFEVLKWVLIVLAAGFVGQFGKRLADHLIARSRRRRAVQRPSQLSQTTQTPPTWPDSPPAEDSFATKTAKKYAKAEIKRSKKSGG